jgi:hypothetical protein
VQVMCIWTLLRTRSTDASYNVSQIGMLQNTSLINLSASSSSNSLDP